MPKFNWDAELMPEERDALIEKLAQRALAHGLATPVIFFLELHKPFGFLASQFVLLGSGILTPLFGAQNVQQFSKLLESRENIERLIRRIEELSSTPQKETVS